MTSWRPCPFVAGRRYRVVRALPAPLDRAFEPGETVTFEREAYSAYHGMTGYFFRDDADASRALDVADDERDDTWQRAFEPVD